MPRRSRLLAPVGAAVVVIIAGIMFAANFWTDYKWFDSVGYTSVFWTELRTRGTLFAAGALVMALAVGLSVYFAYRTRPAYRPFSLEQQGLDRYRSSIDPHRKIFFWGLVGGLALLTGASASAEWQTFLQFANATEFGVNDAQFGMDVSFFAFTYPFLRVILGYLFAAVVIAFIAAVIVHYLYGGVRLQSQGQRATPAARVHLSILLGVFVLLRAGAYWLDQYGLLFSSSGYTFGASYTDVNAVLYATIILFIISLVCAALFFANIYFKNAMVPLVSLGLLVLSAVLIGGVYPAIVQQITVAPNEQRLENPYIQRNIEATRTAYGVDTAEVTNYDAQTELTPSELADEAETIPSVRLVDPAVVSSTFQQLQQVRGFYQFPDVLDVDRYTTEDGDTVDTIVAARELSGPPAGQDNWLTRHLVYTHGFGVVAAAGNQVDAEGRPVFTEYNIPPTGDLSAIGDGYEPRIYFGREGAEYVIVNAEPEYDYPLDSTTPDVPTIEDAVTPTPEPSPEEEADEAPAPADGADEEAPADGEEAPAAEESPDAQAPGGDSGQATNRYDGDGGVVLSSFFDKLLYAVRYQEMDILLNSAINDESQILYERDPADRVEKVAPFLTVDGKPYPAVVDGKVQWILDAYTTSNGYPYSTPIDLANATADTFTQGTTSVNALPGNEVNYIRNSVKATVDAYDGTVTLYGWDESDPVLQTWSQAFPELITERAEISDDLESHLRYPDDLFKVQREILKRYHITDANAFYGGQDFWDVPNDPTKSGENPEPPYRQTLRFPGDEEATFSLTSTFVPRGRENLAAFMAVDGEASSDDYGQLQILELPRSTAISGPGQIQNAFEASAAVREVLLPLEQSSARVTYGNLLTLPFAGGLLYVEPLYVQAGGSDQASYPLLQQVLVGFGEEVAVGSNLQEALNNLFEDDAGPLPTPEEGEEGAEEPVEGSAEGDSPPDGDLAQALDDAAQAYDEGQEALRDGDFGAYGEANERLEEALERARASSEDDS